MTTRRPSATPEAAPPPARRRRAARPGVAQHDSAVADEPWLGRIATADGLFVTDDRQRIVSWSSSAQRMLGYSPEEVIGKSCFLVLIGREPDGHPVCRRGCAVIRNARRGRGTAAYEVAARARDGSVCSLSNSVVVLDGPGRSFRVMHLLREVRNAAARQPAGGPAAFLAGSRSGSDRVTDPAPADGHPANVESLTRRELEVLRLFAQAVTIDEVAEALAISVFTARNHIASVQRKLGARNRLEMVLVGMRRGLV